MDRKGGVGHGPGADSCNAQDRPP